MIDITEKQSSKGNIDVQMTMPQVLLLQVKCIISWGMPIA